jgi:hypothetical protein
MKKKLLYLVFYIFIILLANPTKSNGQAALLVFLFGQEVASESFYFSLKIGGNLTNITNWEQSKFRFAMNFGMLATIKLSDNWYLQPEISPLCGKGARDVPKVITGNTEVDIILEDVEDGFLDLSYIDAPILFKYYINQKLHVGFGPYISYLTSASNFYETTVDMAGEVELRQITTDNIKRWDYGIMAEVAYAPSRTDNSDDMNLHLRISYGFSDILKDNPGNAVNNFMIQGMVSFPFMAENEDE